MKLEINDKRKELASIFYSRIMLKPHYGLSKEFVNGITREGIEEELLYLENEKSNDKKYEHIWFYKLFYQIIIELINDGLVKTKNGKTLTLQDFKDDIKHKS